MLAPSGNRWLDPKGVQEHLLTFQDLLAKNTGQRYVLFIPTAVREAAGTIRIARLLQGVCAW